MDLPEIDRVTEHMPAFRFGRNACFLVYRDLIQWRRKAAPLHLLVHLVVERNPSPLPMCQVRVRKEGGPRKESNPLPGE